VRSRNLVANLGANARALIGEERRGLTKLRSDTRRAALVRLRQEALDRGANAVVALGNGTSEIGDNATEVVACGPAVTVRRRTAISARDTETPGAVTCSHGQAFWWSEVTADIARAFWA
jgi:uncharacterized protein YbjQ (UPF0145 family)